jgi:hypothetical protein
MFIGFYFAAKWVVEFYDRKIAAGELVVVAKQEPDDPQPKETHA